MTPHHRDSIVQRDLKRNKSLVRLLVPTLSFPTLKAGVQDRLGELVRLYIADLDNPA
jgi:hypothetical protein